MPKSQRAARQEILKIDDYMQLARSTLQTALGLGPDHFNGSASPLSEKRPLSLFSPRNSHNSIELIFYGQTYGGVERPVVGRTAKLVLVESTENKKSLEDIVNEAKREIEKSDMSPDMKEMLAAIFEDL